MASKQLAISKWAAWGQAGGSSARMVNNRNASARAPATERPGRKPKLSSAKSRFQHGLEELLESSMNHPVSNGQDAQATSGVRFVRLGDFEPAWGGRSVAPVKEIIRETGQPPGHPRLKVRAGDAVR